MNLDDSSTGHSDQDVDSRLQQLTIRESTSRTHQRNVDNPRSSRIQNPSWPMTIENANEPVPGPHMGTPRRPGHARRRTGWFDELAYGQRPRLQSPAQSSSEGDSDEEPDATAPLPAWYHPLDQASEEDVVPPPARPRAAEVSPSPSLHRTMRMRELPAHHHQPRRSPSNSRSPHIHEQAFPRLRPSGRHSTGHGRDIDLGDDEMDIQVNGYFFHAVEFREFWLMHFVSGTAQLKSKTRILFTYPSKRALFLGVIWAANVTTKRLIACCICSLALQNLIPKETMATLNPTSTR
jgi:hypothetical protein